MRWQTKVNPLNREQYLDRCRVLARCLKHADAMPPLLVVANCYFVLRKAFGSEWLILRWLLLNMVHDRKVAISESLWWTWHYHIRQRTRDEIVELIDRDIEEMTGSDCREWPNIISDEEEVQL